MPALQVQSQVQTPVPPKTNKNKPNIPKGPAV
jgi:hypothetical protein